MQRKVDRWRFYGLALREAARSARSGLASIGSLFRMRMTIPKRLLLAPQDLRTADPTVANDIYAGFFVFAGRAVATGGRSPFLATPPSHAWGEALYGFGWLRHMRAAGTALAQANARALVDEFLSAKGGANKRLAYEPQVTARRLISFISQSPLILEGADHAFYQRFLRALGRMTRCLERESRDHPLPYRRLSAAIALCYAGLCCEGLEQALRLGNRQLVRELDRQIAPDGSHISRNPRILMELLLDLLPLRQIYASRGIETPEALQRAVDRMLPMLRLFRHNDGTLSHFNGMGITAADHLATLLMYDEARAQPIQHAPYAGYDRLEAGKTLIVADVGSTPPVEHSAETTAGCLSFELSSGGQRIVINCGMPRSATDAVTMAARSTAAHSTASLDHLSQAEFLIPNGWGLDRAIASWLIRRLGPVALTGPTDVQTERTDDASGIRLASSHNGYKTAYGLTHQRRWTLSTDGDSLEGEDTFILDEGADAPDDISIRFHLAPHVKASRAQSGRVVILILPNREGWQFESTLVLPQIEESLFFSATDGARRTEQIVLALNPGETQTVRWRFERLAVGTSSSSAVDMTALTEML